MYTCEESGAHLRISFGIYWWTLKNMCTKNHNHMRYSAWDTEWDNIFLSFWVIFCPLPPPPPLKQPTNPKFLKKKKKNEKSIWRCHHFKLVQQKTRSNNVCFLRYGVWQTELFIILDHFLLFFPTFDPKN